ncbi:MAG: PhoX family protein [Actinomycetota bacterium]|nr:PhoX family protein [Actinomycetota bacterium]
MRRRTFRRRICGGALGSVALVTMTVAHASPATSLSSLRLGFTPITTHARSCSENGLIKFANNSANQPVTPTLLMQAGDAATPVNAPASSNAVGRVNDMIALSPDGHYLFTSSENSIPTENGVGTNGSDGITRLTLTGHDKGKKEILANNVDPITGANLWQRVDGLKWYPYGGPTNEGVLLAGEEFSAGGIWQINPQTGAFARLDWLGHFSHEGIGLDRAGNLYLGDEARGGAIYKAVPNNRRDLSKGGRLSYLVGIGTDASGWKQVSDPANASAEAGAGGAILFDRPEDFDEANDRVYFTVTEPAGDATPRHGAANQIVNRGGVYSMSTRGVPDLSTQSGGLPYNALSPMIEVNDPTYTAQEQAKAQQGLQFPDNIAFDGAGHLWVHEDIPDNDGTFPTSGIDVSKQARDQQDELYVYVLNDTGNTIVRNPDTSGPGVSGGYKAADMRTSPGAKSCENEFTGGIFAEDGKTLYINQQHYDNPTLTITIG